MPPIFQTRRPLHFRHAPPPSVPPAPAAVVHVIVVRQGDNRFMWQFDAPFQDPGGEWTIDDFAGLTVDGTSPYGFDEVIGVDGNLTLLYPFDDAADYAMLAQPTVLIFDVMPVTIIPAVGPVT